MTSLRLLNSSCRGIRNPLAFVSYKVFKIINLKTHVIQPFPVLRDVLIHESIFLHRLNHTYDILTQLYIRNFDLASLLL